MKTSLRFEHTPQAVEKAKRRRRKKVRCSQQPPVEVVNIQEGESPVVAKWVSKI